MSVCDSCDITYLIKTNSCLLPSYISWLCIDAGNVV